MILNSYFYMFFGENLNKFQVGFQNENLWVSLVMIFAMKTWLLVLILLRTDWMKTWKDMEKMSSFNEVLDFGFSFRQCRCSIATWRKM